MNEFGNILIDKSRTVRDALKQLNKTGEKILFVVDDGNILKGSLSDGDIRRWILNEGSLTEELCTVCFSNTFTVSLNYQINEVKQEFKKRDISHVPVLDNQNRIIDILKYEKIFNGNVLRKPKDFLNAEVVVMAGGKGTRLDPFTKILPKPLIPIGEKTILEIIIEKFTEYQVNHFYISVSHKAKIIKSYFEELAPPYKLTFLYEDKPLGTIGAVKQLEDVVRNQILLTNCDIIIETDYNDLLKHHKESKNDITVVTSLKHYHIPYGICEIENGGSLVRIKEKPGYDFHVNTGMYVINPDVLEHIPENKFYHITDLIEKIKSTHKIGIYPIGENSWVDIGEWGEYKKAVEKLKS